MSVRLDTHRVEQFAAQELHPHDALDGVVREIFLEQEQIVGKPHAGSAPKIESTCANDSTISMRAPLPPWSGFSSAGQRSPPVRSRGPTSLNVIDRGPSMPSVRNNVAWALLLSSSAKTSAPLRTRAPSRSSDRITREPVAPRGCGRADRRWGSLD